MNCGGASSISPALRDSSAAAGRSHPSSWISPPSAWRSAISSGHRAEEEVGGEPLGGLDRRGPVRDQHERVSPSTIGPGLLGGLAHRGPAGGVDHAGVAEVGDGLALPVAGIDLPAREDPRSAGERQARVPAGHQHLERRRRRRARARWWPPAPPRARPRPRPVRGATSVPGRHVPLRARHSGQAQPAQHGRPAPRDHPPPGGRRARRSPRRGPGRSSRPTVRRGCGGRRRRRRRRRRGRPAGR